MLFELRDIKNAEFRGIWETKSVNINSYETLSKVQVKDNILNDLVIQLHLKKNYLLKPEDHKLDIKYLLVLSGAENYSLALGSTPFFYLIYEDGTSEFYQFLPESKLAKTFNSLIESLPRK